MVHRVAWQDFVPNGESEGEAENDAGLAGAVVALLCELLEEVVATGYADLTERDVLEERQHERAHVPLVQQPRRAGEPVFEVHIFEPVGHKRGKGTVGTHPGKPRMEQISFSQLLLQRPDNSGTRVRGDLDMATLAVPVSVAGPREITAAVRPGGGDRTESTYWSAWSNHQPPPSLSSFPNGAGGRARRKVVLRASVKSGLLPRAVAKLGCWQTDTRVVLVTAIARSTRLHDPKRRNLTTFHGARQSQLL